MKLIPTAEKTCIASGYYGAYYPSLSFDDNYDGTLNVGCWLISNASGYIQVDLGSIYTLSAYAIGHINVESSILDRAIKTWNVLLSNTGEFNGEQITWDTRTNIADWKTTDEKTYILTPKSGRFLRIDISTNCGDQYTGIGWVKLYDNTDDIPTTNISTILTCVTTNNQF